VYHGEAASGTHKNIGETIVDAAGLKRAITRLYFGSGITDFKCQNMCESLGLEGCCQSDAATWGGCNCK
jgi:hypothetical protein